MGTQTSNFKFYKPTKSGDSFTWGDNPPDVDGHPTSLNGNWDRADVEIKRVDLLATGALPKTGGILTGVVEGGSGNSVGSSASPVLVNASTVTLRGAGGLALGTWAADGVLTTVNVSATCDASMKTNIHPMDADLALVALRALVPCQYEWKHDGRAGVGFIAQDVAKVTPSLVVKSGGAEALMSINIIGLVAYLVGAVQALANELDTLKARG